MSGRREDVQALWARTSLRLWPEDYALASLPAEALPAAAAFVASRSGCFLALVLERDEVSLTAPEGLWRASPLRARARRESGPYRAITLDLDLDLGVCGYLAPAAARLAAAGISIVPQCGFLKDHLLVHAPDVERAVAVLEAWIGRCRGATP
ncbi:MAG TPA: ACT domain-containing protein [Vicinamibacteria bacterium]|nr:ACT domain-containing protein [Vicinamibacteria bacterium]